MMNLSLNDGVQGSFSVFEHYSLTDILYNSVFATWFGSSSYVAKI